MNNQYFKNTSYRALIYCGIMAGVAEVCWAYIYTTNNALNFSQVGVEITKSVLGNDIDLFLAAVLGLLIHILLSVLIAFFYGYLITYLRSTKILNKFFLSYLCSISMLICIWWLAYFIILPFLNQDFILLIPANSAIYSKLLFGITMATFYLKTK
ncbi:MAG: hypothetical protein HRT87_07145 [Legionellales bacterium]|nr:hypothetical protein [Legionellales bacterium]